jgi:hypothetical protein
VTNLARFFPVLVGLSLAFPPRAAAVAPPAPDVTRASLLVRQLGASSFAAREEAVRQLLRLGPGAAPALREGPKSRDPEVRRRCEELLPLALAGDADRQLLAFVRGSKGAAKLVGWAPFSALAGTDRMARLLYFELYRQDRGLLDLLAVAPAQVGAQLPQRIQRAQRELALSYQGKSKLRAADLAGLLVAACSAPSLTPLTQNQLTSLFYYPQARTFVQTDPGLRRLASKAFARHGTGPNSFYQTVYLAKNLELTELIEQTLKPLVRARVREALTQPPDFNKLAQAVNLVANLDMQAEFAPRLEPVVARLAREVIGKPDNQGRTYQVVSLLQQLKMQDTIDAVVRPGAVKLAQAVADRPDDQAAFYRALFLARSINSTEALDVLKVAGRKLAISAASQPNDRNRISQALYMTQALGLTEARDAVLRPAVRKQVLAMIEQSSDIGQLQQACYLADSVGLADLTRDTIKPLARRQAAVVLKGSPNLNQIQQVQGLAAQLGLQDVTEDVVKPAVRKFLLSAEKGPQAPGTQYQVLALARNLRLKEGVGFATRVAQNRGFDGQLRGYAVMSVAHLGTREQVLGLEPLLGDTTNLGQADLNGQTCQARLGDAVLGVLVHSTGQSVRDYGFPYFQLFAGINVLNAPPVFFGFHDGASRDRALARWKKWSAGQKK